VPFKTYAPQFYLALLSVISVVWGFTARYYGWVDYNDGDAGLSAAFVVNMIWVAWNGYFAAYVVRHSIRSRQMRSDHRFAQKIPTRVRALLGDAMGGEAVPATTQDINSSGLSFRCTCRFPRDTLVEIPLRLSAGEITTVAIVTHVTPIETKHGTVYQHGVVFQEMPIATRDAIELHSAHHAIPHARQQFRQSMPLMDNAVERFVNPRGERRIPVGLPALIGTTLDGSGGVDLGMGLLEEWSETDARFVLDNPIEPGTEVRWDVPGTTISGKGKVAFTRAVESPLRASFVVVVRREATAPAGTFLPTLRRWLAPAKAVAN
jgi:hypothetical protein